jgi:hypothetical protein
MNKPYRNGLEEVVTLAVRLPPQDKIRLIERVASALEQELTATSPAPRRSLYGWCADLGAAPSVREIDETRREAWANFPREDVASC